MAPMEKTQRFYLNEDRYVVDKLDWSNNGLVCIPEGLPEEQEDLRWSILRRRLDKLFRNLLSPNMRRKIRSPTNFERYDDAQWTIGSVVAAIGETHAEHVPDQTGAEGHVVKIDPLGEKMQDVTSVGLFVSDVELLVQNLYGNFGKPFSKRLRRAIINVLKITLKGVLKDLWREYDDACIVDGALRTPPGYGVSGSDVAEEINASERIAARAQTVRTNPTRFGKYTVQFIRALDENWKTESEDSTAETDEDANEEVFYEL
jgi:hypothetical protein